MTLVFNGDVDGLEAFNAIGGGDVLVARAALSNPFIFKHIKEKRSYGDGPFDPSMKDPYLVRTDEVRFAPEKISLIQKYLACARKYDLRKRLYAANLKWLTKGVTAIGSYHKALNQSEDAVEATTLFDAWLSEHKYL
jgi:tRNA-dihydrouridine synthase